MSNANDNAANDPLDPIELTTTQQGRVKTTAARLEATIARMEADGWTNIRVEPRTDSPGQFLIIAEREAPMPAAQTKPKGKPIDPETPGGKLRKAREAAGLSQGKVARIAGVTNAYVSDVENGRKEIGLDVIYNLAIAIGVDPKVIDRRFESVPPEQFEAERVEIAARIAEKKRRRKKSENS